jgi:hypothetical protein
MAYITTRDCYFRDCLLVVQSDSEAQRKKSIISKEKAMSIEKEPAFPFTWQDRHGDVCAHTGMTKLEYFAGQAMRGILANGAVPSSVSRIKLAVICAKNLIEELEQST